MWNEGSESEGPGGMDCLQLRQQPAVGPFHYLISEQAKSLVALQELQHEVGALLEFRDLVMETFPNLRTKLASSTPATMTTASTSPLQHSSSNIPVSIRHPGDWTPGVRVRKKLNSKEESRNKKAGDIAIQDSGFSTETSSKETHSASSTAPAPSSAAGAIDIDETEDELWNLLDVIHRKGTRLKDEVEALQGTIRDHNAIQSSEGNFQRALFHASADDVRQLRQERDLLLDRLAEMEAEVLAGRVHTSRLQEDLENLLTTKQDLEEQLRSVVSQRGEVNSRIHDLHLQFVAKSAPCSPDGGEKSSRRSSRGAVSGGISGVSSHRTRRNSELDRVFGDTVIKVDSIKDKDRFAAILKERDPLVLQKCLLNSTVQNQFLLHQLDSATRLKEKLDKAREENEELKFQLEDKNIELEGTRARVRVLENRQKPLNAISTSPDIIPLNLDSTPPNLNLSRTEISTPSMKAMSPLPLNLQMDHNSSTESAHDHHEGSRGIIETKRKPSKIPLKSYTAPKPPVGGNKSPAPTSRSRSGESPHRSHSAHSWRNKSESTSLNNKPASLQKSRNSSLVSAKDSLSNKKDSLNKSPSFGSNRGTLKKSTSKWSNSTVTSSPKDNVDKINLNTAKRKSQSQWILSSYSSDLAYPDSLDHQESRNYAADGMSVTDRSSVTDVPSVLDQNSVTDNSTRFHTANTFVWNKVQTEFYDSIDTNMASSMFQHGEELAECDSLEKMMSYSSDKK